VTYTVIWLVAILTVSEGWKTGTFTEPEHQPSLAACERHVGAHTHRMADWARGNLGVDFSHHAVVQGQCKPLEERDA
jgi:hypothetical protein